MPLSKTRLDPVLKLQERKEEKALERLADAQRERQTAEQQLAQARAHAMTDARRKSQAAQWQLIDSAHSRALTEVAKAQRSVHAASDNVNALRSLYLQTHTRTEALRRVTESRRHDLDLDKARADARILDELGILRLHSRSAALSIACRDRLPRVTECPPGHL